MSGRSSVVLVNRRMRSVQSVWPNSITTASCTLYPASDLLSGGSQTSIFPGAEKRNFLPVAFEQLKAACVPACL